MGVVGDRGQITIEKAIRERLGLKPKDVAVQEIVGGQVVVYFLPAPHRRSLRGILKPRPRKPIRGWRQAQEAIQEAVAREFQGREG